MRGIIGILLIVGGFEVCYLVLSGKLPPSGSSGSAGSGGTGTGTAAPVDIRQQVPFSLPGSNQSLAAMPVPGWKGLSS